MSKGYFLYRLPNDTTVYAFQGEFESVNQNFIPSENEFIFHGFDEKDRFKFSVESDISINDFQELNSQNNLIQNETTFEEYEFFFSKIHKLLKDNKVNKVVLSRIKHSKTEKKAITIFESLNELYQHSFNYLFSSSITGTWIGASPEILLEIDNNKINTMSLAGTKSEKDDWSEKELLEQKLVTDFIVAQFNSHHLNDVNVTGPFTINAGPIQHLKSIIEGTKKENNIELKLIDDLHPTPATSGYPKNEAISIIKSIEKHKRNFYTGYIGLKNQEKISWFVNLRCMQKINNTVQLYLGGGILKNSDLQKEWIETENKAKTLMRVL